MEKIKPANAVSSHVLENVPPKSLFFCSCCDFEELTADVCSNSPHFGLFLAADASKLPDERVQPVADALIGRGLAWLSTWGPSCERVHDVFDLAAVQADPEGKRGVIMTTWHSDESLSEALWFFVNSAFPDKGYEKTCLEWIVAGVGNEEWNETLRVRQTKSLPKRISALSAQ